MLIFHWFFYVFGSSKAAGTDPAQIRHRAGTDPAQIRHSRRTTEGRIQESFFPLEEPYSETLLGNYYKLNTFSGTKNNYS